jgi:hypothetical protein
MFKRILLLSAALAFYPLVARSQFTSDEIKPVNCEHNIAQLEMASQQAGNDKLIIIARLGDGERNRKLNWRRLQNARAYLSKYITARNPETIILAEGERVTGYGRIEIYVGGKLFSALAVKRNEDLIVGSCEPEQLDDARQRQLRKKLYPWRDRNK